MDVVRAFVGVHGLQVHHMAYHMVFVGDAVAAVHVARRAGDSEGFAAIIALDQGNHLRLGGVVVEHAAHAQGGVEAEGNLGLHVGKLELDDLVGGERSGKLLSVERILAGSLPTELGGTHGAPGNAEARLVEAAERSLEATHARQQIFVRHEHAVHGDLAGGGGAQRELALDTRKGESVHAALKNEAAYHAVIGLGPYHGDVGDRRIGDPGFRAGESVAARGGAGAGDHAAWVGAVIGLGEPEAADELPAGQARQVFVLLGVGAEGVDGVHHQAGLHAHGGAVGAVDSLHLAGDQAVTHMVHAGAAIAFYGGAEQAEAAHFAKNLAIEIFLPVGEQDARHQAALAVIVGGIAYGDFLVAQLRLQIQRVVPGHFSRSTAAPLTRYPAMARTYMLAQSQKSFGSFLQKRTALLRFRLSPQASETSHAEG